MFQPLARVADMHAQRKPIFHSGFSTLRTPFACAALMSGLRSLQSDEEQRWSSSIAAAAAAASADSNKASVLDVLPPAVRKKLLAMDENDAKL
jgi:hypothetical protein